MPRSRNIKPAFFKNEYLSQMSFEARLLFIGLWTLADKRGRLEDRPLRIKAELFPFESVDMDRLLEELASIPEHFIIRYEVKGERYIQVVNFHKHQNPHHRETESLIPPLSLEQSRKGTDEPRASLGLSSEIPVPALLIPDSLNLIPDSQAGEKSALSFQTQKTEVAYKVGEGQEPLQKNATFRNDRVQTGTIWDEGEAYFIKKGIEPTKAKAVINQATKDHGLLVVSEALSVVLAALPDKPLPYFETVLKSKASKPVKRDPLLVHDPTLSPFDCAEINGCGICMPKVKAMNESLEDCA